MDSWKVEINPEHRTDHYLTEVMHARLIRTQTEALGVSDHTDLNNTAKMHWKQFADPCHRRRKM